MCNAITRSQIYLLDQDEAPDFYTSTPGLELAEKSHGSDFGIRDPFGNAIRIGHLFDREDG